MNSQNDKDKELQRREEDLLKREQEIRLRELEAELHQPPLYKTVKHQPPENSVDRWSRKAIKVAQFVGIVVAVVVTIRVATMVAFWLGSVLLVGAIAWVAYKMFLDSDRPEN